MHAVYCRNKKMIWSHRLLSGSYYSSGCRCLHAHQQFGSSRSLQLSVRITVAPKCFAPCMYSRYVEPLTYCGSCVSCSRCPSLCLFVCLRAHSCLWAELLLFLARDRWKPSLLRRLSTSLVILYSIWFFIRGEIVAVRIAGMDLIDALPSWSVYYFVSKALNVRCSQPWGDVISLRFAHWRRYFGFACMFVLAQISCACKWTSFDLGVCWLTRAHRRSSRVTVHVGVSICQDPPKYGWSPVYI
jgi:hypothetical protein